MKALMLVVACVPVSAQWVHYPTAGIPRTPDGKPNMSAAAPKTPDGKPDFSGIWVPADGKYLPDLAVDGVEVPFQPWDAALYKERQENHGKGRPSERCLTHGVTDFDALATPRKIIQTPGLIAILFESYNHWRQIFLDGRPLPKTIQPVYMGYSVGKWDGDTLVVETAGFNDQGWLDDGGHPQTEALHVTERLRRPNFGHIDLQITIDDPGAYTKPWTVNLSGFNFLADEELMESICEDRDAPHMVGK
ncbi:MAG TPA: hypothetical protein VIY49_02005 [Bryobacteraceae bacterium]